MHREGAFQRARWPILFVVVAGLAAAAFLTGCGGTEAVTCTPADGATGVPITVPIRLTFARPVDHASVEAHFHVEPENAGSLVWEGTEATFQPHGALVPDSAYTITLDAGVLTEGGQPFAESHSWQFHTRPAQLLYLGRVAPGDDHRQLFLASLDGSAPRQLTDYPLGVWDYAVHPQGEEIVYSVLRDDGGSDLWRMDRDGGNQQVLLSCPKAACLAPAWSPDGRQLAYERRDIWADAPNLDPKAGRIWLLDVEKGKDRALFDYDVPAHSPVWSPYGDQLAYLSPLLPGVEVYNPVTTDLRQFDNQWGTAPTWSPDGRQLVVPDLLLIGGEESEATGDQGTANQGTEDQAAGEPAAGEPAAEQPPAGDEAAGEAAGAHEGEAMAVRLVRIDVESGEVLDISGDDDLIQDSGPVWSPGGGWIAVARQFLDEARWTPGRQIWLTRPDASEAYALLTEPMADHFAFAWRPDGGVLAYLRTDLSEGPQMVPDVSVWMFDFGQGKPVLVAEDGVLPQWLP